MASFLVNRVGNALERAEELINVGKKLDALLALHDLITSKRCRAWQKPLERIMFKYVELCVDLRKGHLAKDGLIQFRILCQQVNVCSLEDVIKHFMHLAAERVEQACSEVQALEEALNVDDLEADTRPEDLMLSYVSGEKWKDRSDRQMVTPWFKFLWETYRTVLDVLRNNSKLEGLYAMTAQRAFQFCKQYKRTTEFRRLCEIIRGHLANLNKYRDQRDRPDLSAPDTLQHYLDTRFEQLNIATELKLWQEAFRSVEDIHGLMCLVRKTPKPSLMVIYYAKLTEVFWISSSNLYHAYAWLKLFTLQKSFNKNLSQKDLQLIASSVVLAALAVAPQDHKRGLSHRDLENEKDCNLRMTNLIEFNFDPKNENGKVLSRSSLLSELVSKGVLSCATEDVKDLYSLLEQEFLPLDVAGKVQPLLHRISELGGECVSASSVPEVHLSQYVPAIENLATLRLLQQVSRVYHTMKIDSLSQMIPFFDFSAVEKISVDAVKQGFIGMKVDHMKKTILFCTMDVESDRLNHLANLAETLSKAMARILPPAEKSSKISDMLPRLCEIVDKENKRLLTRKLIIEKRKEEQERQLLEKEREEELRRLKLQKITEEAEQKRLAAEYEQRKKRRILQEIEERELEEARVLLEETGKHSKRKGGKKPVLEGEKVTKQTLIERASSEQLRERQEMEKKLQKLAKTLDYLERAKREEEAPLVEAAFQRRAVEEGVLHEHQQQQEVEESRQQHDRNLMEKNRLSRMVDNKMIFKERVINHRRAEFDRQQAERDHRINQIIHGRKFERSAKRKKLFYVTTEEERLKKLHEEEEARKREEADRRRKEEAERRAKLDEIAEKQRQRELELEEKERLRREALLGRSTDGRSRPSEVPPIGSHPVPIAASPIAALAPGKYVPKFRRGEAPSESGRWGSGGSRQFPSDSYSNRPRHVRSGSERWSHGSERWSHRGEDQNQSVDPVILGKDGDRWGSDRTIRTLTEDDRRGSEGSKSTRSSSRCNLADVTDGQNIVAHSLIS